MFVGFSYTSWKIRPSEECDHVSPWWLHFTEDSEVLLKGWGLLLWQSRNLSSHLVNGHMTFEVPNSCTMALLQRCSQRRSQHCCSHPASVAAHQQGDASFGDCQPGSRQGAKPWLCNSMLSQDLQALTLLYCVLEAALPPCTSIISSCTRPQGWKTCDVVQVKHRSFKFKGSFLAAWSGRKNSTKCKCWGDVCLSLEANSAVRSGKCPCLAGGWERGGWGQRLTPT